MSERDHDTRRDRMSDELRPYVDRSEAEAIDRIAERLLAERPAPRAAFRAALNARLLELAGSRGTAWRPRRLRALVAAYAGSGVALLAIAAIGLAGVGPLAP
jgi:IS5 family transposase